MTIFLTSAGLLGVLGYQRTAWLCVVLAAAAGWGHA